MTAAPLWMSAGRKNSRGWTRLAVLTPCETIERRDEAVSRIDDHRDEHFLRQIGQRGSEMREERRGRRGGGFPRERSSHAPTGKFERGRQAVGRRRVEAEPKGDFIGPHRGDVVEGGVAESDGDADHGADDVRRWPIREESEA
jgi:hypothetical protein